MSWIITGGLGSKRIITQGYYEGPAEFFVREIIRGVSKLCFLITGTSLITTEVAGTSEINQEVTLTSKIDLEVD